MQGCVHIFLAGALSEVFATVIAFAVVVNAALLPDFEQQEVLAAVLQASN